MCGIWTFKKDLTDVVTCDYIFSMKTKATIKYPELKPQVMELREAVALPGVGLSIPVRAAKAKFFGIAGFWLRADRKSPSRAMANRRRNW